MNIIFEITDRFCWGLSLLYWDSYLGKIDWLWICTPLFGIQLTYEYCNSGIGHGQLFFSCWVGINDKYEKNYSKTLNSYKESK